MEKDEQDKTVEISQQDETVRRWKKIRNATNGKEQLNLISSNLRWTDVLKGPILRAWSPVIPEVTQLPDAKIVIFDLALAGPIQELARARRNLR